MRLSIALCTYNGERFVEQQLKSFLQQSRLPDELIICDDASQDSTLEILKTFQEKAPFTVKIYQNTQNLGISLNFSKAIEYTTGDIIFLADQDDVWLPNKLETMATCFTQHSDVGVVYSDAWIVKQNLDKTGQTMWKTVSSSVEHLKSEDVLRHLLKQNHISGAMMAFRATLKPIILPISPYLLHDYWIVLLAAHVTKFYPLSEPLILYRQHANNQIGANQLPLWKRIRSKLTIPPDDYMTAYLGMSDLRQRIEESGLSISPQARQNIENKESHWQARANLPESLLHRTQVVVRELYKGRYQRYSTNGLVSAIRDWLAYFFDSD